MFQQTDGAKDSSDTQCDVLSAMVPQGEGLSPVVPPGSVVNSCNNCINSHENSPSPSSDTPSPPLQNRRRICGEDHFLMSDILFCHVSVTRPCLVAVVVKSIGSSKVVGHVFECPSESAARNLYKHYHLASNKYKLDRYRDSKRRSENTK